MPKAKRECQVAQGVPRAGVFGRSGLSAAHCRSAGRATPPGRPHALLQAPHRAWSFGKATGIAQERQERRGVEAARGSAAPKPLQPRCHPLCAVP